MKGYQVIEWRSFFLSLLLAAACPALAQLNPSANTGNQPPTVSLIAEGGLVEPSNISLVAAVSDPDGYVRRVEFYAGDHLLAKVEVNPILSSPQRLFRWEWRTVVAGEYQLTARATDNAGATSISALLPLNVKPSTSPFLAVHQPTEDTSFTASAKILIEVVAVDPRADIRLVEFYANEELIGRSEHLTKEAVIPGRPRTHRFEWMNMKAGVYKIVAKAKDFYEKPVVSAPVRITIKPAIEETWVTIIAKGSIWRFSNDGTDQQDSWRLPDFNDRSWRSGAAQLGYGDGDETTVTYSGNAPRPITAYFRHAFDLPDPSTIKKLAVRLVRDDGAAVYLNGREIWRDNLPTGILTYETRAITTAGTEENAFHSRELEPFGLVKGQNVIAVEVHQASPTSSDLSFDLKLDATVQEQRPTVNIVATQPETIEPSPNTRVMPGVFTISRTGSTDQPLTVACWLRGTASLGKDYELEPSPSLAFLMTIPAGKESLRVLATPIDDTLVEGDETIVLDLIGVSELLPISNPYLVDPAQARATVVIHDNDQNTRVTLNITSPKNGARFKVGEPVEIRATAIDPQSYINRIEFYDRDKQIGVSELIFIRAPDPGTPIDHSFIWSDASIGEHVLTVRAVHSSQGTVVSDPVVIQVNNAQTQPIVLEVVAADAVASESPDASGKQDTAVFVIKRISGPLDVELPVFISLKGTASSGIDFTGVNGITFLKSGLEKVEIIVTPVADDVKEGDETVILRLEPPACDAIFPPPLGCYQVGPQGEAKVIIKDSTVSHPPKVVLVRPADGAVFTLPALLEIRAEATDTDGKVVRLDILADNELLGTSKESALTVKWQNPTVGTHRLTAKAVDDSGLEGISSVEIRVRSEEEVAFVRRELPPAYVPGLAFSVELRVEPPSHGSAYAIEDQPPAGWAVSDVSDDGAFDAVRGRVKFGPFTDKSPGNLTYRITPPADAKGRYEFKGSSSLDGKEYAITGDALIEPVGELHPADIDPGDKAISMKELTSYAAAWKEGQSWPSGPAPIPLGYVTRAGALWKGGESYIYDPSIGAPPNCWINPSGSKPLKASGITAGHARRFLPNRCFPGQTVEVKIKVESSANVSAWAVEERVPVGWTVSDISNEGRYDARTRSIRWGLFYTKKPHVLSCRATAPAEVSTEVTFNGLVAFDGIERPIEGDGWVVATDEKNALRIKSVGRHANGSMRLQVAGPANQLFAVEVSSDLVHWFEAGSRLLINGELEVEDDDAATTDMRYYRLRPIGK